MMLSWWQSSSSAKWAAAACDGRSGAGAPKQVQIVYDTAAIDGLKAKVARLKAQNDAVKQLAREAEKKGEIAKHKSLRWRGP